MENNHHPYNGGMLHVVGNLAKDSVRELPEFFLQRMEKKDIKTLRQLAVRSGVNYHTLRDAIFEGAELGMWKAIKIADTLDVSLDDLAKQLRSKS